MSRLRYLNPFRIRAVARQIRRITGGGGPKRLRLQSIGHPEGVIVPTSRITLEVEARDGTKMKFEPDLPVPWPYAWTWRLARLLKVPLVRSVEPENVRLTLPVPHRRGPVEDFELVTRRSFPGAVVDAAITLARLPADLALSAVGEGPVASLVGAGVDAADGAARGLAGTLLGDEQLRRDAERRLDEAESSVAEELAI